MTLMPSIRFNGAGDALFMFVSQQLMVKSRTHCLLSRSTTSIAPMDPPAAAMTPSISWMPPMRVVP